MNSRFICVYLFEKQTIYVYIRMYVCVVSKRIKTRVHLRLLEADSLAAILIVIVVLAVEHTHIYICIYNFSLNLLRI